MLTQRNSRSLLWFLLVLRLDVIKPLFKLYVAVVDVGGDGAVRFRRRLSQLPRQNDRRYDEDEKEEADGGHHFDPSLGPML